MHTNLPKIHVSSALGKNKISDFDSRAKSLLNTVFILEFRGPKNGYFQHKIYFCLMLLINYFLYT